MYSALKGSLIFPNDTATGKQKIENKHFRKRKENVIQVVQSCLKYGIVRCLWWRLIESRVEVRNRYLWYQRYGKSVLLMNQRA